MSNETRNKIAVLKKARESIYRKKNIHVCVATESAGDYLRMKNAARALVREIGSVFLRDGVGVGSTVGTWLQKNTKLIPPISRPVASANTVWRG